MIQASDYFRGMDLPQYPTSTAKGNPRITFLHHNSDLPLFYHTNNQQFYQNTDNGAFMTKIFSFPLYNGNSEFFSCDCMRFLNDFQHPGIDYFISGLYPEIKYETAPASVKPYLDELRDNTVGRRFFYNSLPLNQNGTANVFGHLVAGTIVSVAGFSCLFMINRCYSLHISNFKIVPFYELFTIDFSLSRLNELYVRRLFCPASLLDVVNLKDDELYKEAVKLRFIIGGNYSDYFLPDVLFYEDQPNVDYKIGIADRLLTPKMDTL